MKTLPLVFGVCATFLLPAVASAMTDAECNAAWTQADVKKTGVLSEVEGGRYYAALRVAQKPVSDGKLTQADFLAHCKAGLFNTSTAEAGAPLKGANSFTEAQARQRMEDQGYSGITDLKKDDQSIWRGMARKGGVSMSVALDFQGNVVGGPAPKR